MNDIEQPAERGFHPVRVANSGLAEFFTDQPGTLRLGRGELTVQVRFDFKRRDKEWGFDLVSCVHRIADAAGTAWEAEGVFTPRVFMRNVVNLARWPQPHLSRLEKHEAPPLIVGIGDAYDDRAHRYFIVDDKAFHLRFKYLGVSFDIYPNGPSWFQVFMRRVWGDWCTLTFEDDGFIEGVVPYDEENEEANGDNWGDYHELPAISFTMEARDLLFRNTVDPAAYDERVYGDNDVPLPLRFHRTDATADPQPLVTFHPFATS